MDSSSPEFHFRTEFLPSPSLFLLSAENFSYMPGLESNNVHQQRADIPAPHPTLGSTVSESCYNSRHRSHEHWIKLSQLQQLEIQQFHHQVLQPFPPVHTSKRVKVGGNQCDSLPTLINGPSNGRTPQRPVIEFFSPLGVPNFVESIPHALKRTPWPGETGRPPTMGEQRLLLEKSQPSAPIVSPTVAPKVLTRVTLLTPPTRFLFLWNLPIHFVWNDVVALIKMCVGFSGEPSSLDRILRTNQRGEQVFWLKFHTLTAACQFRDVVAGRRTAAMEENICSDFASADLYNSAAGRSPDLWRADTGFVGIIAPDAPFPAPTPAEMLRPAPADLLTAPETRRPTRRGRRGKRLGRDRQGKPQLAPDSADVVMGTEYSNAHT